MQILKKSVAKLFILYKNNRSNPAHGDCPCKLIYFLNIRVNIFCMFYTTK